MPACTRDTIWFPDRIIDSLKSRERDGAIELPPSRPRGLQRGDTVRVLRGPFVDHVGVFAGMKPRGRVDVLLMWLGAARSIELRRTDVVSIAAG